MLVLSRDKLQSIMIGDDIEIIVVAVKGDKVRIGFRAPQGILIYRKEVWEAIQEEKKEKK